MPDAEEDFAAWLTAWREKEAAKEAVAEEGPNENEPKSPSRNTGFYGFHDEVLPKTPKEAGPKWI